MNLGEYSSLIKNDADKVIVYGAGVFGEYTFYALKYIGITPLCFCDRAKSGRTYHGLPVMDYMYIKTIKNPVVLLAVGAQYIEVSDFLSDKGIDYYDVYELCFQNTVYDKNDLTEQTRDVEYYKLLYQFGRNYRPDEKSLRLFSVDWVITEKCSLRCKDCSNLMQYYHNPVNKPANVLLSELCELMKACDEIMDVRIIGGEPFMNPELTSILEKALVVRNINNFSIYTNATILPSSDLIHLMKNSKVKCEISDYGTIVKNFPRFIELMEENGIRYHVVKMNEWHKLGALVDHKRPVDELKRVFSMCYCNDLITLLDGKLYRCPYSANGRNLNAIPYDENDVIDVYGDDKKDVRNRIRKLVFEKDYDMACGYCDGRNYHLASVEPAIQINEPLDYQVIDDNGLR